MVEVPDRRGGLGAAGGIRVVARRPGRQRRGSRRVPALVVAVVGALVVLAASACQPLTHPSASTVEPAGGPTLVGLADDGAYAFVQASAAGATVPGPGYWRVDRATGAAVALPDPANQRQRSADGRRIWYRGTNFASSIWNDGTVVTPPLLIRMSANLRWGAFVDPNYHVRRWSLATQTHQDIEVGFPRPDGFDSIEGGSNLGVSDDGNVVWFPMRNLTTGECRTRFVNLAFNRVDDFPYCGLSLVVAAGTGTSHLFIPGRTLTPSNPYVNFGGPGQIQLVHTVTHEVQRVLEPTQPGGWFDGFAISDNGWVVWAVEATATVTGPIPPSCGTPFTPPCGSVTVDAHQAVAATPTELATFPVDGGLSTGTRLESATFTTTANGRWLAYATGRAGEPVHVLDRLAGTDEALAGSGPGNLVPWLTADGTLVAHPQVSGGWFEHEVASPGA